MSSLIYKYYAIIPHSSESGQVLVLPTVDGWTLPFFTQKERRLWAEVDHVNREFSQQLGLTLTALCCFHTKYDEKSGEVVRVFAMENHSPTVTPPDANWINREDLVQKKSIFSFLIGSKPSKIQFANIALVPTVEEWFDWMETMDSAELRVPWYKPGWYKDVKDWINSQLARIHHPQMKGSHKLAPAGAEQLRTGQRSAIIKVKTVAGGVMYFKAVPPMFHFEPGLTNKLSKEFSGLFPEVLSIEKHRYWFLMSEVQGVTLDRIPDLTLWEEALRKYARIQVALHSRTTELAATGCPVRKLEQMAQEIEGLLADQALFLVGEEGGLTTAEIKSLREYVPQLKKMCADLMLFNIPYTLEHGDFWPGQIIKGAGEGAYTFIDLSDASIAHPFFSMNFFQSEEELRQFFPDNPTALSRLRDAYLEAWAEFEPRERLVQAFELAQRLAPLHLALIYRNVILPNMEVKWEMEAMVPYYLKMLLKCKY